MGFLLEHLSLKERYYCRHYSMFGELVLTPRSFRNNIIIKPSDSCTCFSTLGFSRDISPKTMVSLVCLFCFL